MAGLIFRLAEFRNPQDWRVVNMYLLNLSSKGQRKIFLKKKKTEKGKAKKTEAL